MKPIEFPEVNEIYAKDQPNYLPLPVFKNAGELGELIICWKLSFRERIKIFFTGKLWNCILTHNDPLQPMAYSLNKKDIFKYLKSL